MDGNVVAAISELSLFYSSGSYNETAAMATQIRVTQLIWTTLD